MTIEAYCGDPGQGKTYLMTRQALKKMNRRKNPKEVYANYDLKGAHRFNQLEEVFHVENAIICVDEMSLVAPAGFWKSIPFDVIAHWRQHRHAGVDLWYTAQDFQDVASPLRRVTQFKNEVNKFGPFFKWSCTHPRKNTKYGGGITLFDKEVGNAYNTHGEFIAKQDYLEGK